MSGLIYAFTGEGKGKTSAALGVATRALLLGKRVGWVAFYKQASWGLAEAKLTEKFSNLEMVFGGKGFRITKYDKKVMKEGKELKLATVGEGAKVVDTASEAEHKQAGEECVATAEVMLGKQPFLLVLDEVLNAVSEGVVESRRVREVIEKRGETHVVLTGRGLTPELLSLADLVSECRKIKHPYDLGQLAVAGLDY